MVGLVFCALGGDEYGYDDVDLSRYPGARPLFDGALLFSRKRFLEAGHGSSRRDSVAVAPVVD